MSVMGWVNWLVGNKTFVVAQVESRLEARPYLDLKHVSCAWHDGVLTLRGRVPTQALRRIAEALARRVEGTWRVENEIEVVIPQPQEVLAKRLTGTPSLGRRREQQF